MKTAGVIALALSFGGTAAFYLWRRNRKKRGLADVAVLLDDVGEEMERVQFGWVRRRAPGDHDFRDGHSMTYVDLTLEGLPDGLEDWLEEASEQVVQVGTDSPDLAGATDEVRRFLGDSALREAVANFLESTDGMHGEIHVGRLRVEKVGELTDKYELAALANKALDLAGALERRRADVQALSSTCC